MAEKVLKQAKMSKIAEAQKITRAKITPFTVYQGSVSSYPVSAQYIFTIKFNSF